jgi:hypothetical protein
MYHSHKYCISINKFKFAVFIYCMRLEIPDFKIGQKWTNTQGSSPDTAEVKSFVFGRIYANVNIL